MITEEKTLKTYRVGVEIKGSYVINDKEVKREATKMLNRYIPRVESLFGLHIIKKDYITDVTNNSNGNSECMDVYFTLNTEMLVDESSEETAKEAIKQKLNRIKFKLEDVLKTNLLNDQSYATEIKEV